MSLEHQGPVADDKAKDRSEGFARNGIEDELSPIDPMEILSRGKRPREKAAAKHEEAAAAPSPVLPEQPEVGVLTPPALAPPVVATAEKPEPPEEEMPAEDLPAAVGEEFDHLLGEYLDKIHDFSSGDIVEAEIVDVKHTYVLVDVGDKAEGIIDIDEFVDPQGEIRVAVGDRIPVQILSRETETGQINVSYRRAAGELAWQRISDAVRGQTPVSGRVVQVVKSGLLVDIGVPAFMPASQIDTSRVEKLDEWVNREVEAYVLDVDRERRRVVLSRRKLIQEDEERKRRRSRSTSRT